MKIFKVIFLPAILILFAVSFQSCNNDSPTSENNSNVNSSLVTSLGGLVNNITATSRYMKAIVGTDTADTKDFIAGTDSVGSDNMFNISLSNPPASALYNLSILFPFGATISNPDATGNSLYIGAFNNKAGQVDGALVNSNIPPKNIQVIGDYIFFICIVTEKLMFPAHKQLFSTVIL
ncbi:MAG TPA: hypothetical protein PKD83_04170 [Ignavibacteria bacterium]|nr:hypothetical protein [Ignavibacteria bacterium]